MKSVQTPWTKTGITATDVTTQVSGPSRTKADIVVPKGTAVHFIGHWVVADLRFFAEQEGATLISAFPSLGTEAAKADASAGSVQRSVGRGSMAYHDADHYGIAIPEADVTDVKEVTAAAPARHRKP